MPKISPEPEIPLSPSQLPETNALPPTPSAPPRELPKPLADFKEYVDSKFCYYSGPMAQAEMTDIKSKVAYQCQMKILMEDRTVEWTETAHSWGNETLLGSRTLGRLFESTSRHGEGMGDIWSDYNFPLPSNDKKSKQKRNLPEGNYLTRCSNCRGKCVLKCTSTGCNGDGRVNNNTEYCSTCHGKGIVRCSNCKGLGGFLHSPTLVVKWHTRQSTFYCQNSYLPEKKIRKGGLRLFWSAKIVPWAENSSIANTLNPMVEQTPGIELKMDIIKHYNDKHLNPTKTKRIRMRRLQCLIERMDFDEVQYTMGDTYMNKKNPAQGNTFRFCQYPGPKGKPTIYENDYPLNCCGCFGEKAACYSCCCNIL